MRSIFSPLRLSVIWTLLILAALSIPGQNLPAVSVLEFDKVIHVFLFAVLTALWLVAKADSSMQRGATILGFILLFAIGSEFYQEWMPIGRSADLWDSVADSIGALLSFLVWVYARNAPGAADNK